MFQNPSREQAVACVTHTRLSVWPDDWASIWLSDSLCHLSLFCLICDHYQQPTVLILKARRGGSEQLGGPEEGSGDAESHNASG